MQLEDTQVFLLLRNSHLIIFLSPLVDCIPFLHSLLQYQTFHTIHFVFAGGIKLNFLSFLPSNFMAFQKKSAENSAPTQIRSSATPSCSRHIGIMESLRLEKMHICQIISLLKPFWCYFWPIPICSALFSQNH